MLSGAGRGSGGVGYAVSRQPSAAPLSEGRFSDCNTEVVSDACVMVVRDTHTLIGPIWCLIFLHAGFTLCTLAALSIHSLWIPLLGSLTQQCCMRRHNPWP